MDNKMIIASLQVNTIPYGNGFLKADFNITLDIWKEEDYYLASYPPFDINLCEKSIEDTRTAFEEEICFLWDEYAKADDRELSSSAISLKNNLLQCFQTCIN